MTQRKPSNPFYVLVVLAGVAFFVTASAYGVMTIKGLNPEPVERSENGGQAPLGQSGLMEWLDDNGFQLLMVELVVLAICTVAAIGTDCCWQRRDNATTTENGCTNQPE